MSGVRRSGPHEIDTMQVCLNGHVITRAAERMPYNRQAFCTKCGAETIAACQQCGRKIPGMDWDIGVITTSEEPRPTYCHHCGTPYPWQQSAIANAIEMLEELGIDQAGLTTAKEALSELIADTPKVEVAALRLRRVLRTLSKPAYDVGIKVVSDLVSETIKKTLLKP